MRHPLNISVVSLSSKTLITLSLATSAVIGAGLSLFGAMLFSLSVPSILLVMVVGASLGATMAAKYLSHAFKNGKLRPQVRFGKVLKVNMIKKIVYNQEDDNSIVVDKAIEDEIRAQQEEKTNPLTFQTATLLYDTIGETNNTDTFLRDQALINARIVLLSMDHTKQIPH